MEPYTCHHRRRCENLPHHPLTRQSSSNHNVVVKSFDFHLLHCNTSSLYKVQCTTKSPTLTACAGQMKPGRMERSQQCALVHNNTTADGRRGLCADKGHLLMFSFSLLGHTPTPRKGLTALLRATTIDDNHRPHGVHISNVNNPPPLISTKHTPCV